MSTLAASVLITVYIRDASKIVRANIYCSIQRHVLADASSHQNKLLMLWPSTCS